MHAAAAKFRPNINSIAAAFLCRRRPRSVVVMTIRMALLAGLLALAGCGTTSGLGGKPAGPTVDTPPVTGGKASMVGGLVTGDIGKGLNSGDRRKALEAEYKALEYTQSGQAVNWAGDGSGRSGNVVPAQPYRVGSQDCRQYTHTIVIDGATRTARGTACRNTDGSWATLS
jgi:surface antigen